MYFYFSKQRWNLVKFSSSSSSRNVLFQVVSFSSLRWFLYNLGTKGKGLNFYTLVSHYSIPFYNPLQTLSLLSLSEKRSSDWILSFISGGEAPKVKDCPNDIEVTGRNGTAITWTEPIFTDNVKVTRIRSNEVSVNYKALNFLTAFDYIAIVECVPRSSWRTLVGEETTGFGPTDLRESLHYNACDMARLCSNFFFFLPSMKRFVLSFFLLFDLLFLFFYLIFYLTYAINRS